MRKMNEHHFIREWLWYAKAYTYGYISSKQFDDLTDKIKKEIEHEKMYLS